MFTEHVMITIQYRYCGASISSCLHMSYVVLQLLPTAGAQSAGVSTPHSKYQIVVQHTTQSIKFA